MCAKLCLYCLGISCPTLGAPLNGMVSQPSLNFGSTATYSCTSGYQLAGGDEVRTCMADATWSGGAPQCNCKCAGMTTAII